MNRPVEVTVGALVVEGLPVHDSRAFGDAVGSALARLVTERGLPAVARPAAVTVTHDPLAGDRVLAESVAGAIWAVLAGQSLAGQSLAGESLAGPSLAGPR